MINAKILIYLLLVLEGGPIENPLNLTEGFVRDVKEQYGYEHAYKDVCSEKGLRRAYTLLYLRRYKALDSYEDAIRVFTGGKEGMYNKKADAAWRRAKYELNRVVKMAGLIP